MTIALAGQFDKQLISRLESYGTVRDIDTLLKTGDLDVVETLVTRGSLQVTSRFLTNLPRLTHIVKAGSGLDNIDLRAAERLNILVERTGGSERSVAELSIALMLACSRHLRLCDEAVQRGDWFEKRRLVGTVLVGSVLGLVGFGPIARETARLARCFGLSIVVCDRSLHKPQKAACLRRLQAETVEDLEDLARKSDIVSLHLPSVYETQGVVGTEFFNALHTGAILINTSRADIVDRKSLVEALRSNALYAGLDVHYDEIGTLDHEIVALPNVICTPHIGAQTDHAHAIVGRRVIHLVAQRAKAKALSGDE